MWFDVEMKWITTPHSSTFPLLTLWFDVEMKWITTKKAQDELEIYVVVWCRNEMNYNYLLITYKLHLVVVWCRNEMNYNQSPRSQSAAKVVVWCRNEMNYNGESGNCCPVYVVVWCRNEMNYNSIVYVLSITPLWFDVEMKWITTKCQFLSAR